MRLSKSQLIPFLGLGLGVSAAAAVRMLSTSPFSVQEVWLSKRPLLGSLPSGPISLLNRAKQFEIKGSLKLLSPFYPLAGACLYDQKVALPEKTEVVKLGVSGGMAIGLTLLTTLLRVQLGLKNAAFNASGHLMMAVVTSWYRAQVVGHINGSHSERAHTIATSLVCLYGATDALFLFRTTCVHHSLAEMGGGALWGTFICGAGYCASWPIGRGYPTEDQ